MIINIEPVSQQSKVVVQILPIRLSDKLTASSDSLREADPIIKHE